MFPESWSGNQKMPVHPTLKIREIFWSFQGEGLRVGIPSVFIRLAGCSLGCDFCDTRYALEDRNPVPIGDIFTKVDSLIRRFPASQAVITGGEPLEQNLETLVAMLKDRRRYIAVETNGIHFQNLPIDWWTVSPKPDSDFFIHEHIISRMNEVKLVVTEQLSPDTIGEILKLKDGIPVFLQPRSGDSLRFKRTFELFSRCQQLGFSRVRIGYQVHRIFGAP